MSWHPSYISPPNSSLYTLCPPLLTRQFVWLPLERGGRRSGPSPGSAGGWGWVPPSTSAATSGRRSNRAKTQRCPHSPVERNGLLNNAGGGHVNFFFFFFFFSRRGSCKLVPLYSGLSVPTSAASMSRQTIRACLGIHFKNRRKQNSCNKVLTNCNLKF